MGKGVKHYRSPAYRENYPDICWNGDQRETPALPEDDKAPICWQSKYDDLVARLRGMASGWRITTEERGGYPTGSQWIEEQERRKRADELEQEINKEQ